MAQLALITDRYNTGTPKLIFSRPSHGKQINLNLEHNHVRLRVSLRVLHCVLDTGFGLCRPTLTRGGKYQMVKTQTERN